MRKASLSVGLEMTKTRLWTRQAAGVYVWFLRNLFVGELLHLGVVVRASPCLPCCPVQLLVIIA